MSVYDKHDRVITCEFGGDLHLTLLLEGHLKKVSLMVDGLLTHLTELRKVRICKQGNVSDELVNNVWFRGVHRSATVADVLSRVEHSERKAC